MNKDKRNNIKLLGTLTNADESGIIANANQIYDANEDKSTQDVSKEHKDRIETLETKESSMQTTLENISKTGEASAASNVTYNHSDSKLDATNVQQAVDEMIELINTHEGNIEELQDNVNEINLQVTDGPDDFSIQDEAGNILCLWKDGHIKTKNFDSQSVGGKGGKAESDSDHIKFKTVDGKGYEQHEYIEKPIPTISFVTPLVYCNASDAAASYIPTTNKFAAAIIAVTSQDVVTIPYLMGIALDITDSAYATQGTGDYPITLGLYNSAQSLIGVLDKTTTAQTNKVIDFRKELTLVKSSTTSTYTLTAGSTYYLYIQTQANPSSVTDSSTTDDYVNACKNQINAITIESHVLKDIRAIDANNVDIINSNAFDFDIKDENQNILVGLKDGHIKTKNFDSKETLQVIDGLKNFCYGENVAKVIYNCPIAGTFYISAEHQCLGFNDSIEDKNIERKLNYTLISYRGQKENSICYIHVGFLDQRGWWIESDKYAGSISYTEDPKIIKITPNSEITLKYNEFLFFEFLEEPFSFYFSIIKSENYRGLVNAAASSLYDHTVLRDRTDYTTLYYWENNYQYIKPKFASKKEMQSVENSINDLNTNIENSNIFKDTITGKKYKLKVENGNIVLQSMTFTKIYFAGNSFTYHGNMGYWWGNGRGMAASSYNTQYVEFTAKIFGATYDKLNYAHIIEEHLNDDNFDVSAITELPSSDYDLVVIQLGENSTITNETNYKINVSKVINRFKELAPKATIIWITGWHSSTRNPIISKICEQEQINFLDVGSNTSIGSFRKGDYVLGSNSDMSDNTEEHEVPSTILSHPSDVGMALIANAIGNFYKAENNITLYNININNGTGGSLSMPYTKWPAKGLVSIWCIPYTGKSLKSFKVVDINTSNEIKTNNHINSDSKLVYTFIMPESDITINTTWE